MYSKKVIGYTIQVDTREQKPWLFPEDNWETVTLPVGDYGLRGYSDFNYPDFIWERKSKGDLTASLGHGRERFMREMEKLRVFRFSALAIEADREDIVNWNYTSRIEPASVLQTLAALEVRNGLHIVWGSTPEGCQERFLDSVRHFTHGIVKDFERLLQPIKEKPKDDLPF